jgi:hypothetical protein
VEIRFDRIEERLDRIVDVQSGMQADIREHMRRTEIAESNIEKLAASIAPVQEHVAFVRVLGKFLAVVATVAAIYAAVK